MEAFTEKRTHQNHCLLSQLSGKSTRLKEHNTGTLRPQNTQHRAHAPMNLINFLSDSSDYVKPVACGLKHIFSEPAMQEA